MQETTDYTKALNQLKKIVTEIESGDLTIDALTDKVHEASKLVAACRKQLRSTEDILNQILENTH